MKKLLSILTLLVVAVTGAWADEDPTLSIGATAQTSATFLKEYATEGITISSTASWSGGAVQLGNTPSSYDSHYLQIAADASIVKVSFLMSGNGSDKTLQAPAFGWEETPASNQADTYYLPDAQTTTANSYAAAKWFDYDFSGHDVKFIRVYRTTKNISSTDPEYTGSSTALGSGNTIKIYGIKVWLKAQGPVDPSFSLTKTSIGTDETSQIKVEGKDNLDGITLSNITYGTSGVVTVNETTGVVTPVAVGTTTISFNSSAVTGKYNAGSGKLSITVTAPQVATPTLPATGTFFESKSVEISCATDGATIKYSYDNTNWTDYTTALNITETKTVYAKATKSGYTDSEVASATYTKFVKSELAAVSNNIKWNFNADVFNTERSVTATSSPALDEELTYADFAIIKDFELPASFDGTSLSYVGSTAAETAYPTRNKATQAVNLHIKTTVPGTLTVTFSDTGSSVSATAHKRYLNINGTNTEFYTSRPTSGSTKSNDKKTVTTDVIPAGDIWIKAMKEDGTSETLVCFYDIEFNPAIEVTSAEWATTTTPNYPVTFDTKAKVYVVASVEGSIQLTQISDAPANTPIIVNAAAGSYTMTPKASAAEIDKNLLRSKTANSETAAVGDYALGTWLDGSNTVVGFGRLNAAGVDNMTDDKAFIPASLLANAVDFLPFVIGDEESETTSINSIENGESRIENSDSIYNLAGQKVSKDYKGIVIVNGKKVIRK